MKWNSVKRMNQWKRGSGEVEAVGGEGKERVVDCSEWVIDYSEEMGTVE